MSDRVTPMFCRDCGHDLRALPNNRCPGCSLRFNLEDPTSYDQDAGPLVSILRTESSPQAYALRDALADFGIPATVTGDLIDPSIALISMGAGNVELWVGKRHEHAARDYIVSLHQEEALTDPDAALDPDTLEMICPACDEPVPGNFAVCWNCGTDLVDD